MKTFKVDKFKEYINIQLSRTDEEVTSDFKAGLCIALKEVLHRTGNYKGFQYLYWEEIGCQEWRTIGKETEIYQEKKKYIYGTPDSKYKGCQYSRRYY